MAELPLTASSATPDAAITALLSSTARPPRASAPSPSPHSASPTAPLWLTLLACAAVLVARRPELFSSPQFWAEDSTLFFFQAWEHGARALLAPYAGYLHTTQRLVAALAVRFDPLWAPAIFVGASLAFTLYVAARTQSRRFPFGAHPAFALAVVFVPDAFEVLLFLVNIQWFLAAALVLLLISSDAHRPHQHAHDALAAILLGLTGPFSVLFAPLFLWRALHRRTRASTALAALMLACATVQLWFIAHSPTPPASAPDVLPHLLAVPGMRLLGSLFVGHFVPPDYPLHVETLLGLATGLSLAAFGFAPGRARAERSWLALATVLLLAASLYRCRQVLPHLAHATFGSRYFLAPQLLCLWALAALLTHRRRWIARTATVALLWILVVNVPRLRENALPDLRWSDYAAKLRAGEAVTVPTNPAGWSFLVPARPKR